MNDITKVFFNDIGISKGMSVLDVGCGRGVTSEIIAELVGPDGQVVGLDASSKALEAAKSNAQIKNLNNIEYLSCDLMNLDLGGRKFDTVVGRRILKYLPNPKTVIGNLSKYLKPNGVMGFQEHDSTSMIDNKKMPLHYEVNHWIWKLVETNGGNTNIGKDIWDIFNHESISIKSIKSEPIIQTPQNDISLIPILQNLSGLLTAKGIASESDLSTDLFEGLELEKKESNSIFIRELIFFVTAQKV